MIFQSLKRRDHDSARLLMSAHQNKHQYDEISQKLGDLTLALTSGEICRKGKERVKVKDRKKVVKGESERELRVRES